MGPSGSGKTTLLDVLSQRRRVGVSGSVLVNGRPVDNTFSYRIGYVTQEDVFAPTATTLETLQLYSSLRFPHKDVTRQETQARFLQVRRRGPCFHEIFVCVRCHDQAVLGALGLRGREHEER